MGVWHSTIRIVKYADVEQEVPTADLQQWAKGFDRLCVRPSRSVTFQSFIRHVLHVFLPEIVRSVQRVCIVLRRARDS